MTVTISAKDVSELRKATGAGMMDCKNALKESGGEIEGALEYLRKKGQKVAAKRADRDVNEGVVVALTTESGDEGVILAVSCESDFVAKNDGFIEFANSIGKLAIENLPGTVDELLALPFDGATVAEKLVEQTGKIGEKTEVSGYHKIVGQNISSYIHAGNKIGVVVSYKGDRNEASAKFFRGLAMHITAMNPSILSPEEFDAELVAKETEALQGQITVENEDRKRLGKPLKTVPQFASKSQLTPEVMAKAEEDIKAELTAEGKPEKIWDKIIPGKLDRFISDNTLLDQERCLLSQVFALDDTKTVEAAVKDFDENAEIIEFKRVAVG